VLSFSLDGSFVDSYGIALIFCGICAFYTISTHIGSGMKYSILEV